MTISYEQAMDTLTSMFESWDRETIEAVFQGNECHMERTIDSILAMEGGSDVVDTNDSSSAYRESSELTLTRRASTQDESVLNLPSNLGFNAETSNLRGTKCILADDFLRPLGYQSLLADEQLAIMLQDELFRREVMEAMGSNAPRFTSASNVGGWNPTSNVGRMPNNSGVATAGGRQADGFNDPLPDMGILKGLQGMSDGVRKQLSALATKFSANRPSSVRYAGEPNSNPMLHEREPLVHYDHIYQEEEGNGEIINFESSNRSQHALNDDYDADSRNPMAVQRSVPLSVTTRKGNKGD